MNSISTNYSNTEDDYNEQHVCTVNWDVESNQRNPWKLASYTKCVGLINCTNWLASSAISVLYCGVPVPCSLDLSLIYLILFNYTKYLHHRIVFSMKIVITVN
jgi:hypothetical protein